ncbi:hypothetical protein D3874_12320 [Oleomonas cavernae]|uniref:Uncharacterized protein n=2 Tax=Oleomonas cavernae TaxID=2320859 RepID=A0A418WCK7_9PROT|nr:hypothetical protein D3874_12320 [Oleomonas cavernae]
MTAELLEKFGGRRTLNSAGKHSWTGATWVTAYDQKIALLAVLLDAFGDNGPHESRRKLWAGDGGLPEKFKKLQSYQTSGAATQDLVNSAILLAHDQVHFIYSCCDLLDIATRLLAADMGLVNLDLTFDPAFLAAVRATISSGKGDGGEGSDDGGKPDRERE